MVSLCANYHSEYMWKEYARNGTGFVIEFDMTLLGNAGMVRPIQYTDDKVQYFTDLTAAAFYRKKTAWSFEVEWRLV